MVIATKSFNINIAEQFKESVSEPSPNTKLYLVIGRVNAWANDLSANAAVDNIADKNDFWRKALGGKKITGNDLNLVTRRIDWTANTVYAAYSDKDSAMFDRDFYVLTDEFNVYKCLANNSGANSTIKPTYTTVDITYQETDGYIWKYMYTLGSSERARFLTEDWMPVKTLAANDGSLQWKVQDEAIDGSINIINVSNNGTGYTNTSNLTITISGDGTGANATASINTISNVVSNITVTSPGSGYTYANVTISGGGGSGAVANVIISPPGGHGSDPVEELGASNILINIRLRGQENGKLTVGNEFRQIALLKNPLKYEGTNVFSNLTFSQTTDITVTAGADVYLPDEFVYQGVSLTAATFSGRVVDYDSTNSIVRLVETAGTPTTALLYGNTSGITRFIVETQNPEILPYSGRLLYMDNILPIDRDADQTENIKLILQF